MARSIHFGVFLLGTGNHTAGWRYPGADQTFLDIKLLQHVAAIAERGLFDFLFLGDGLAANLGNHPSYTCRLEPLTLLSALSMTTTHVGLAATMSTTYSDPYTVARAFASLDHISGGRAAWNAVTTSASAAGGNFGRAHPNHELRYKIAEEFINVVRGLWDCWSDKAIIADLRTGKFFDESEVKPLNHEGPRFSVKGPLNMGRCPQGQPLVLQAGGSERGQILAARTADVVFSVVQDFEEARVAYPGLKERIRRFGRDPDSVTILPGVMPIIGKTDAEARDILNTLQSYLDSKEGLAMLSSRLGVDISKYALDGPIPDLPLPNTSHGFARALLAKGKRENLSRRNRLSNADAGVNHDHPAAPRNGEIGHCVHNIMRAPGTGDVLYQQNHHGVWRSADGGRSWDDLTKGLPSTFGFPIRVHPRDPNTIWTLPLNGDMAGRFPPDAAAAVWRSRDGGQTWQAMRQGLPQESCFFTVLRQAMAGDERDPAGIYFGTNTGSVFASFDEGENWQEIARHLPTILAVEVLEPK
jgi:FMN-dependent oxidoreductase (nitrilotriacetate monooxygenase family)